MGLGSPLAIPADAFQRDDYDELYDIFRPLREAGCIDADPSGWSDTYAAAANLVPRPSLSARDLARYHIDEGRALGDAKTAVVELISQWEDRTLDHDNVTLGHSVSECTLAVLVALKRRGVSTVVFETPGYGVTINQAHHLGLQVCLLPTYAATDHAVDFAAIDLPRREPFACWLTHPRMSLGYDQSSPDLVALLERLSSKDFLVIDEATEQRFPSHLRSLWALVERHNVLRIRGLLKGAGLNGLRLAFTLHHERFRSDLEASQEVVGASLDACSLRAAVAIAGIPGRLAQLLAIANRQTTDLRRRAEALTTQTNVRMSRLVNGYIGCALLALGGLAGSYEEKRQALIEFALARRMPVLLGASMRFARDPAWEQVRVNYFNDPVHVLRGIANLVDFASGRHQ